MSGINVKFGATDAGFTSTVNKVKDSTKSLDTTVAKTSSSVNASFASMAKAGAALALGFGAIKMAAAAVTGTFGAFKDALDLGGELSDLSDQTGETSGNLLVLQRAFDNSGVGADKVGTSLNKMQKALVEASQGSDEARDKFSNLGLSWSEMATKSPTEQLKMIAAAISALPTPAERAAASMEFFGKSGGRTLAFLQDFDGAIANAKGELGTMPDVMDKSARVFDTISDKITVIGGKFKEFAAGVLGEMTPMLETITTGLAGIDMAGFGKRLAQAFIGGTAAMDGFTAALGAMKVGEFSLAWEMAWASIKLQAKQTANEIYQNLVAAFSASKDFMVKVFGPDSAIFLAASLGIDLLVGKIETGILNAALGLASTFPRLFGDAAENIKSNIKVVENGITQSKDLLGKLFSDGYIQRDLEEAGKAFPESFKSAYESTAPLINVQEDMKEVNRLAGEINKTAAGLTWNMTSEIEKIPQLTWNMKDHMKEGAGAMEKAAKTVKETLSLSEEIIKRIKEAAGKDAVDKGGKLEKAAGDAIAGGNFRKAERIAKKLEGKQQDAAIDEAFGGKGPFAKSVRDMAKEAGVDTFGKSNKDLKKELQDRIGKRKEELPDGQRGKANKDADGEVKPAGKTLHDVVEAIRVLVEKIEPKLPTTALGA
jgi:hypothetical protein